MVQDLAIGAGAFEFDSRAGQIEHCCQKLATAVVFLGAVSCSCGDGYTLWRNTRWLFFRYSLLGDTYLAKYRDYDQDLI